MSPLYEYPCPTCSTEATERIYDFHVTLDELDKEIFCPICNTVLKRKDFYPVPGRVH